MSDSMKVKKGDSSAVWSVRVSGVSDYTDYFATVVVMDPETGLSVGLDKVIQPSGSAFKVSFTPAETESLELGVYTVAIEITKDPVGSGVLTDFTFRREYSWQLEITKSLINV